VSPGDRVRRLAESLLAARPLLGVLEQPVRLPGPERGAATLQRLLDGLAEVFGTPPLALRAGAAGTFERIVGAYLGLEDPSLGAAIANVEEAEVGAIARSVLEGGFECAGVMADVVASDGTVLRAYAHGDPARPAAVIASACGMPARLAERWVRRLARDRFTVTCETRGLFGGAPGTAADGLACDVATQAGDMIAVLEHFRVERAHVLGMCGGAVVALDAARRRPDLVASLSLWHGDYELGPDAAKTTHQRDLQALLTMVASGQASAEALHAVLSETMLRVVPPGMAHLVLYPYATPGLLSLYCRLNGSIMTTDVRGHLDAVAQPALVVTSEDDATAHPDGSRVVAAALPCATLRVLPHGDHLTLFEADPVVVALAEEFMTRHDG
jgi:pimeloyl-ACP methyl ester carboxylesterase